jgi:hypothetical protein
VSRGLHQPVSEIWIYLMTTIENICILCGKPSKVNMPDEAYIKWRNGAFIQDAWPEGTLAERETALSGTHSDCFDAAFGED